MKPGPLATRRPLAGWPALRRYSVAAILAAVALVAGGCTQNNQTTQNPHNTPSASGQPGSGPFGGRTPTGVQLGHLLTTARLPAGWGQLTGGGPPEIDSGQSVHAAYGPQPTNDGCAIVNSSATVLYFTNWWSVSDATLSISGSQASGDSNLPIMDLTVAAFRPAGDIAKTLQLAAHVAATCRSFNDHGSSVAVSSAPVPQLGSQALYLESTEQSSDGSSIVAQVVLDQVGGYLVGANTDNATSSNISQATMESMVSWLAGLLKSG